MEHEDRWVNQQKEGGDRHSGIEENKPSIISMQSENKVIVTFAKKKAKYL